MLNLLTKVMKKLLIAVKRSPKLFLSSLVFGLTTIWTFLEPVVSVIYKDINRYWFLVVFIIPSVIIAFVRTFPKKKVTIRLKNTNSTIHVKFGDLFGETDNIAIAVNEYFDSVIGKLVSPTSIHGKFIKDVLGGKSEIFDQAVLTSLNGFSTIHNQREDGKHEIYPIGTTAVLEFGGKKYLLFVLSKTNEKYEAHTTPGLIFESLNGLLTKARSECNGGPLNIPLIGTGLSRSGIPPKYVIDLILIALLKANKEAEVTKEINIIIAEELFEEIDLNEIARKWN